MKVVITEQNGMVEETIKTIECHWWQSIWWHLQWYFFVMWASGFLVPELKETIEQKIRKV